MKISKDLKKYKSNSFSLLFKEKKYALELFNYFNDTDHSDPDAVEIVDIEGGFNITVSSDSLFIVDDYVNISEHQSTDNPNMPLRIQIYLSYFYRWYIKAKGYDLYGTTLIKIPTPRVAVFYNGEKNLPDKTKLKLSDAFIHKDTKPCLELICTIYNINPGHNSTLMSRCGSISSYTKYVEKVRRYSMTMEIKDAITLAVDECIKEGILSDFFTEHREEIILGDALDCTFETRLKLQGQEYERLLEEKDNEIAEQRSEIAEKDNEIAEKDDLIAKYRDKYGPL